MFKRHHQLFTALRVLLDLAVVAMAFWGGAQLRPLPTPIPSPQGVKFQNPDEILPTAY